MADNGAPTGPPANAVPAAEWPEVAASAGIGLDRSALESSYAATVGAAKWLLGTASAFAALILAGIGLADIGNTYGDLGRQVVSLLAVLAAAGAIIWVLGAATQVLRVPYRDLTALLRLREQHRVGGNWKRGWAREEFEQAGRAVAAASGGRLSDLPALHRELQNLRGQAEPNEATLTEANAAADIGVAVANDIESGRRFHRLKWAYFSAIVVVLGAAAVFVLATKNDPDTLALDSPVAVRVLPESDEWKSPLASCSAQELRGAAVSGRWPHPSFVTLGPEGCRATVTGRNADDFVVVPLVKEVPRR